MKEKKCIFYCLIILLFTLVLFFLLSTTNYSPTTKLLSSFTTPYSIWWNNYSYPMNELDINDYNKLITYNNFEFDIFKDACNNSTFLLILISSAPNNFHKRTKIRETWGRKNFNNVIDHQLLFVLGQIDNKTLQEQLLIESRTFNDIIQGNFHDSYRNLTYKHLVSFKYAIYHCPQAKYILKLDDDAFVNMPLLNNFLLYDLSLLGVNNLIMCNVQNNAYALRSYRSKWRVSFSEYPLRKYPRYCFGWVILYSPDVLFSLYKSTQNIPSIFWIDDVYITGMIAEKINLNHTDISNLIYHINDKEIMKNNGTIPKKIFLFSLVDSERKMELLWKHVLSYRSPKSVFSKIR